MSKKISAFGANGFQSMRNNDFTTKAALAEVIDNSIQANAKNIKIKIYERVPPGKTKKRIYKIVFGDDGKGMDEETIQYALQVGWSERYNQRDGIGRFGVGMTYGAISACEFVEIYSREKGGNWKYTNLDIESRTDNTDPGIDPIISKDPEKEYLKLTGDYGTIVVWNDIDRIDSDFEIEDFMHWLGRTYRKFIGDQIVENKDIISNKNIRNIFVEVQGESSRKVQAFDPLYAIKEQFHIQPEGDVSEIMDDETFAYGVSEVDLPSGGEIEGNITIRISLTPKSWRLTSRISGNSIENRARWIHENEGVSILRAGREVTYSRAIKELTAKRQTHDRFWSCEIDFDPVLDHQFTVKNMKIGAKPTYDLNQKLVKTLSPKIKKLIKQIEDDWTEKNIEDHEGESGGIGKHKVPEVIIGSTTKPKKPGMSKEDQETAAIAFVEEKKLKDKERESFLRRILDPKGPPFLIEEDSQGRADGPFIDIAPNLGKKVITYNLKHAFFTSVYDKLHEVEELGKKMDPEDAKLINIANELKDDIDYLIYAFADSSIDISGDRGKKEMNVDETLTDIEIDWSDKLRRVYRNKTK